MGTEGTNGGNAEDKSDKINLIIAKDSLNYIKDIVGVNEFTIYSSNVTCKTTLAESYSTAKTFNISEIDKALDYLKEIAEELGADVID